jgi:hypothetical protein
MSVFWDIVLCSLGVDQLYPRRLIFILDAARPEICYTYTFILCLSMLI